MSQGGTQVRPTVQLAIDPTKRVRRHHRTKPKLPVVQVNPFQREREHTWCKDTSLPEFYEKPDIVYHSTEALIKPPPTAFSTNSESQLTSRENRPILPLAQLNKATVSLMVGCYIATWPVGQYRIWSNERELYCFQPNNEASDVTVPVSAPVKVKLYDLPPPPSTTATIESSRARKIVFPQTPRNECITPDNPIKLLPKHGYSPTIVDREKKTVKESSDTKPTSLLNREKTQEFVNKQQVLRLRGMRLVHGHLAPVPSTYLSKTASMPIKSLDEFYRHLVTSYNRGYAFSPTKSRMTAASYPVVEAPAKFQEVSDPLVSLNHENLSVRLNSSVETMDGKSAFGILESAGKQTHIEQNLVQDYKQYYDMNKTGSSATAGHHFTRFLKLKNYNPTQGELLIMVNKEQNRSSPAGWAKSHQYHRQASSTMLKEGESYLLKPEQRDTPLPHQLTDNKTLRPITGESMYQRVVSSQNTHHESGAGITEEEQGKQSRIEISTTLPDINNNST